ncbi:ABC transporter permease [Paradesulfitobacterium ferrireducens]|uniref:ABC transporter permease n=1 Tax=Paradesulfitobacterium ferrireducens TaxID=2816476 RepID=UPI001A8DEF79|nr:ABC transporter permease [Paradesulfitobacterium ferrireducens]
MSVKPAAAGNRRKLKFTTELTLLIAYVAMIIAFSILSPYFLSIRNFMNIGLSASITGITATGMTLVLLMGGLDLSVGSIIALVGIIMAVLMKGGTSVPAVVLVGLVVGLISGLINGLFITKVKINPLITTLSTMAIYRGITFVSTDGLSVLISNKSFSFFGRSFILGIPVAVIIMLILYVFFAYLLRYTKFGRKVYAVGGNPEASRLSGINVDRIRLMAYTISGLTAAVSGIILASQTGTGLPNAGTGMELNAIAAAILGGTSLAGGKGNIAGTLLGVLILSTLSNGLTLLNVPSFYQMIAQGAVLLIAVTLDVIRGGGYK